ncbi:uncharacterized protein LOC121327555 [Polyodon spathula]|uniref:uncharacterized protein LOC121327555 n=1 Tax=Polyodon spathula TaxID=7913 RepID=UPI001B7EF240|nr:uncharacterized protein LOC121327555 [Polyodon spathula]
MKSEEEGTSCPKGVLQLLSELEQGQRELESLREQQSSELEHISASFEHSMLAALQQERSVIDKVEQDYRETRRRLEQLQRENEAAVKVSLARIDERLQGLVRIHAQIQRGEEGQGSWPEHNLSKTITELLPQVLSLTVKQVSFHPNPKLPPPLGEIRIQTQILHFPIAFYEGQQNRHRGAWYSRQGNGEQNPTKINVDPQHRTREERARKRSPDLGGSQASGQGPETTGEDSGSVRVVKKIYISPRDDSEETNPQICHTDITTISLEMRKESGVIGPQGNTSLFSSVPTSGEGGREVASNQGLNTVKKGQNGESSGSQTPPPGVAALDLSSLSHSHAIDSSAGKPGTGKFAREGGGREESDEWRLPSSDLDLFQATPTFFSNEESDQECVGETRVEQRSAGRNEGGGSSPSCRAQVILSSRLPSAGHEGAVEWAAYRGSADSVDSGGNPKQGYSTRRHNSVPNSQYSQHSEQSPPREYKSNKANTRPKQMESIFSQKESRSGQAYIRSHSENSRCIVRGYRHNSGGTQTTQAGIWDNPISQSCLDLSPNCRPPQICPEDPLDRLGETGRTPSPADSIDSSYTFIVNSPRDHNISPRSVGRGLHLSKSTVDLSRGGPPLIEASGEGRGRKREVRGESREDSRLGKVLRRHVPSTPPPSSRGANGAQPGWASKHSTVPALQSKNLPPTYNVHCTPRLVSRSISMSSIEIPAAQSKQESIRLRTSQLVSEQQSRLGVGGKGGRVGLAKPRIKEEECDLVEQGDREGKGHLIRQFGKLGSGRAEFSLPSGVHTTPQGQLYLVDCGNARLQVTDRRGNVLQQVYAQGNEGVTRRNRRCRNYFDVAVNGKGLIALSCAAERALLIFSRHGRQLQAFGGGGDEFEAPRGVTVNNRDEFLVVDTRRGTLTSLRLEPTSGRRLERTVVPGFSKPYLVGTCLYTGLVAVSERGSETGGEACVKVLGPDWNIIRVLGLNPSLGPVLSCPWGVCINREGDVLVADWGKEHRVLLYPTQGKGWTIVREGLSSPRGLTLLPEGHLVVVDSMHNCIKIFQYK